MSVSLPHTIAAHSQFNTDSLHSEKAERIEGADVSKNTLVASDAPPSSFVSLSEEGQRLSQEEGQTGEAEAPDDNEEGVAEKNATETADNEDEEENGLTESEQEEVEELKDRDQEVRTHEQAHMTAGGQYAGSASYTYQQGPDGKRYAIGGEVPIDISEIPNDPQATLSKMQQVYRAALAPAEPSSADRQIASQAQQKMSEAQAEIARTQSSSSNENEDESSDNVGSTSGEPAVQKALFNPYQQSNSTAGGQINQYI